jgi:hypothetical protein
MKYLHYTVTFIAFYVLPFFSFATTYYFAASGSDNNDGLTASTPKRSMTVAKELMIDGNTILFNRGDVWFMPMDTLNLNGKKNITLDAYGDRRKPRPVIAGMARLTNWTYTGKNNIWKCPLAPYTRAHRVWVRDISPINLEHKNGKNNTLDDLTDVTEYYLEKSNNPSATLYLKTNSPSVPPNHVSIIPGTIPVKNKVIATITNSSNITFNNIEFRGGGDVVLVVLAPAKNITFNSCIISHASLHGLMVMSAPGSAEVVENIQVLNCIIDKSWTLTQNDIKSSIPFNTTINGDGLGLWNGVKGGLIKGNYLTNWGHIGLCITTFAHCTSANFGVQNVKVEQNESVAGNSMYMHAFELTGFDGKVKNNIIKRNYFHDYSAGCSIGGNNNFIFSNIFANVTTSPHPNAKKVPWGVNLSTWEVPRGSGRSFVAKDNFIVNNTFYNTATHAILASQNHRPDADTLNIDNNKIFNNLMINYGTDTVSNLPKPRNSVAMYWTLGVAQGRTDIRNNNFWRSNNANAWVAQYNNKLYTASTLNGCAPCGMDKSTGNVSMNPTFKEGAFYKLSASSSPVLRSGGYKYAEMITAQGLSAKEFVDYNGVPWPENLSIGAVQY